MRQESLCFQQPKDFLSGGHGSAWKIRLISFIVGIVHFHVTRAPLGSEPNFRAILVVKAFSLVFAHEKHKS
jgi:hypothetical protein